MITFVNQCAQGEMFIRKIDALPDGVSEIKADSNGNYILAHSETGHHHVVKAKPGIQYWANDNDPFIAYLVVDNTECFVEHQRDFDKHKEIQFPNGIHEIRRQREHTPEGFRKVQD